MSEQPTSGHEMSEAHSSTKEPDYSAYPKPHSSMRVVLCFDSNVFIKHGFGIKHLDSIESAKPSFKDCRVLLPEVVKRECERLYDEKAPKASKAPGFRPPEIKRELEKASSNMDKIFARHLASWQSRFREISDATPTSDAILRAAYERMMAKKPPCHNRDEMRDAIIWETLLATDLNSYDVAIFVSDNTRDFPFNSNSALQQEAASRKILWFKTYSAFENWLAYLATVVSTPPPRPEPTKVDFAILYEQCDSKKATEERFADELGEYLSGLTPYYDSDPEVFDLERLAFTIEDPTDLEDDTREYQITEKWDLSVSFGLSGDFHLGGSDGVDFSASGHGEATGKATVERRVVVDAKNEIVEESIENIAFDLEYDDSWDPQEAWVDSLGKDRDDA